MRKVFEHCIYKNENDTEKYEVTMALRDDGKFHVTDELFELMDPTGFAMEFAFDTVEQAWQRLDDQFKNLRSRGFRYIPLSLEEVR